MIHPQPAKQSQKPEQMDDLFDIIGISLFASRGAWCRLNDMPCIPLTSCDQYIIDDTCPYSSEDSDDREESYK
jgi:hypothetical protein